MPKAWLGFCSWLLRPSPKSQDQEVGLPVDASVKTRVLAVVSLRALNPAWGAAGATVTDALTVLVPLLLLTLSVTV